MLSGGGLFETAKADPAPPKPILEEASPSSSEASSPADPNETVGPGGLFGRYDAASLLQGGPIEMRPLPSLTNPVDTTRQPTAVSTTKPVDVTPQPAAVSATKSETQRQNLHVADLMTGGGLFDPKPEVKPADAIQQPAAVSTTKSETLTPTGNLMAGGGLFDPDPLPQAAPIKAPSANGEQKAIKTPTGRNPLPAKAIKDEAWVVTACRT